MPVTKEQVLDENNKIFHQTDSKGRCHNWRRNGKVTLWKLKPNRFSLPVKYGLGRYKGAYTYIDENSAENFHLASECPNENNN